jgi:hypothetical protein
MAIVQTVGFYEFSRAFRDFGRSDNFTDRGLMMIYDYINNLSFDEGNNIELDVVAICCDYVESDCADVFNDYGLEDSADYSNDELADIAREYLEENTVIIGEYVNNNGANVFIYANF